mmetsp:Transcript_21098/g.30491  ORF Transcript_21098/g.30491 Transcript_21098/m.30491 type:complete len:395 (+) Transcript_21098:290-1474(+)
MTTTMNSSTLTDMRITRDMACIIPLLVDINPSLGMIYSLSCTCKTIYTSIMASDILWVMLASQLGCRLCFLEAKSIQKHSQLSSSTYWYNQVQALQAKRLIRRQWGLLFTTKTLVNNGRRKDIISTVGDTHGKSIESIDSTSGRSPHSGLSTRCFHFFNTFRRTKKEDRIASEHVFEETKEEVGGGTTSPLQYTGNHLHAILDNFIQSESRILLANNNTIRHWHDLSSYPSDLKNALITSDQVCSPPLSHQQVGSSSPLCRVSVWTEIPGLPVSVSIPFGDVTNEAEKVSRILSTRDGGEWANTNSTDSRFSLLRKKESTHITSESEWLLQHMMVAVEGRSPDSTPVRWFTSYVSGEDTATRLVIVAICFSTNGALARLAAITSTRRSFKWIPI